MWWCNYRIFTNCQQSCGKVMFSVMSVCHSVHKGVPHYHYHDALDLTIQGPTRPLGLVQLGPHCTGIPQDMFKLIHYETCTFGNWAVGILLECFPVRKVLLVARYRYLCHLRTILVTFWKVMRDYKDTHIISCTEIFLMCKAYSHMDLSYMWSNTRTNQ